jgi:hypothetical protein
MMNVQNNDLEELQTRSMTCYFKQIIARQEIPKS